MKRKTLSIFSLLLIVLVFFTSVSVKVEDEMATLVDARKRQNAGTGRSIQISTIALLWRDSDNRIYSISEGSGWESGLRLSELSPLKYEYYPSLSHVDLAPGEEYWYVYSASRTPILGSAVTPVETKKGEDTYLLWYPDTIPNIIGSVVNFPFAGWDSSSDYFGGYPQIQSSVILPNSMELVSRSENAALVDCNNGTFPFFEHNIWYTFKDRIGEDVRVYSMHDVEQFIKAIPWIVGVMSLLLCAVILWAFTWIVSMKKNVNKKLFLLNVGLIALFLLLMPLVLKGFDLPASLMPAESIFDISHYNENFERIISSMNSIGDTRVEDWFAYSWIISAIVVVLCTAALTTILLIEYRRYIVKKIKEYKP